MPSRWILECVRFYLALVSLADLITGFPKVLNDFKVFGVTFDGDLPIDGLITNLFETACTSLFLLIVVLCTDESYRRTQVDLKDQSPMVHLRFYGQASSLAFDGNDVRSESMGRWTA